MPQLRKHRRNARRPKRARPVRQRRKLDKFIPSADSDFALTARGFVCMVLRIRDELTLPEGMIEELEQSVQAFRDALALTTGPSTRTRPHIVAKNEARAEAERLVREVANIIRADPKVSRTHKTILRIQGLPRRAGETKCPQRAPEVRFLGSGDGVSAQAGVGGGSGVHVLEYWDVEVTQRPADVKYRKTRPPGAARLELFFDFVPPGQPIPSHPAELSGWPRYLRSFTKRRMEVEVPQSHSGPMLVVYWGRWAGANGEVGRFSKPCVARWEGANVAPMVLPEGNGRVEIVPPKALPLNESNAPARTQFVFVHAPQMLLPAAAQEPREVVDAA